MKRAPPPVGFEASTRAAVGVDQGGDDRQAEAGAAVVAAAGGGVAPEALEDRVRVAGRQARAVVAHLDVAQASVVSSASSIGVPSGVWTIALRSRLAKTRRSASPSASIATGPVGLSEICPLRRRRAGVVAGVLEQLAQVERFARRLAHLVDPRQRQQVVDQAAHPRRLGLDPRPSPARPRPARAPRRSGRARVAADRGQRRAQLVRGVGEEPAQPPLPRRALGEGRLDLHQHRVQGPSQAADLGAVVVRLDPAREVAGGDLPRHLAHPPQRPQPDPDQPPGGEAERDQDRAADDELDQRQVAERRVRCRRAAPRRRRSTPPSTTVTAATRNCSEPPPRSPTVTGEIASSRVGRFEVGGDLRQRQFFAEELESACGRRLRRRRCAAGRRCRSAAASSAPGRAAGFEAGRRSARRPARRLPTSRSSSPACVRAAGSRPARPPIRAAGRPGRRGSCGAPGRRRSRPPPGRPPRGRPAARTRRVRSDTAARVRQAEGGAHSRLPARCGSGAGPAPRASCAGS